MGNNNENRLFPFYLVVFTAFVIMYKSLQLTFYKRFPSDVETRNINLQFLLGSSFLVTPVVHENETTVLGYFPKDARWFDFYTVFLRTLYDIFGSCFVVREIPRKDQVSKDVCHYLNQT